MRLPYKTLEKKMFADGFRYVIGVDEVGMASLAGPVYVCAVLFTKKFFQKAHRKLHWLRDSKALLPHQREKFYHELLKENDIKFQLASCHVETIDRINIYQAAMKAMKRAVRRLVNSKSEIRNPKKSENFKNLNLKPFSNFVLRASNFKTIVLVDGKHPIAGLNLPQLAIVKGDRKIFSIACASIIAKVTRDRVMTRLAKRYPQYGLDKHKGYPTKLHQTMLTQCGPVPIHRRSFAPVAKLL